jgi:hypothetical protein
LYCCYPAILALVVVVLGCSSEAGEGGDVIVHSEERLGVPWEEYLESARQSDGHREYFLVEEDLYFESEDELRLHYDSIFEQNAEKLAVFKNVDTGFEPTYAFAQGLRIRYCISNLFQTMYSPFDKNRVVSEMAVATRGWEDVANVRFSYESAQDAACTWDNSNVEFAVIPWNGGGASGKGCGLSKLQWFNGCVNTDGTLVKGVLAMSNYAAYVSNPSSTGVLRHELGHILGFRHEHPWSTNSNCASLESPTTGTTTFRRLTVYDSVSVMHYTDKNRVGCGPLREYSITALDGQGARSVYGMPAAWYVSFL